MRKHPLLTAAAALAVIGVAGGLWLAAAAMERPTLAADERYAYKSDAFKHFVEDSYKDGGAGEPGEFFQWFGDAYQKLPAHYPGHEDLTLEELLVERSQELSQIEDEARK